MTTDHAFDEMIWVGNWTRYPRPAMVGAQLYGVDVNLIQMWIDWSQSELRAQSIQYTLVHALLHLEVSASHTHTAAAAAEHERIPIHVVFASLSKKNSNTHAHTAATAVTVRNLALLYLCISYITSLLPVVSL